MITVDQARDILGPDDPGLDDHQLARLLDQLYKLGEAAVDLALKSQEPANPESRAGGETP